MTWISDNLQVLFAAYFHKLEQVSPDVLLKYTLVAVCLIAFICGVVGAVLPFILSELTSTHSSWMMRRRQERLRKGAGPG